MTKKLSIEQEYAAVLAASVNYKRRAEAAEASAVEWADRFNMINAELATESLRATQLESQVAMLDDYAETIKNHEVTIAALEAERDEERKERESLYPVIDEKNRVNELLRADVVRMEAELKNAGEAYAAKAYTVTELQRIVSEVTAERDELARQLEQAQQRIKELDATLKDIATAPYENQPDDGNEWEKEYYLRGMHR